jgi:hypothetical protein
MGQIFSAKDDDVVSIAADYVPMDISIDDFTEETLQSKYFNYIIIPELLKLVNEKRAAIKQADEILGEKSYLRKLNESDIKQKLIDLNAYDFKNFRYIIDPEYTEPLDKLAYELLMLDDKDVKVKIEKLYKSYEKKTFIKQLGKSDDLIKRIIFDDQYVPEILKIYPKQDKYDLITNLKNLGYDHTNIENFDDLLGKIKNINKYLKTEQNNFVKQFVDEVINKYLKTEQKDKVIDNKEVKNDPVMDATKQELSEFANKFKLYDPDKRKKFINTPFEDFKDVGKKLINRIEIFDGISIDKIKSSLKTLDEKTNKRINFDSLLELSVGTKNKQFKDAYKALQLDNASVRSRLQELIYFLRIIDQYKQGDSSQVELTPEQSKYVEKFVNKVLETTLGKSIAGEAYKRKLLRAFAKKFKIYDANNRKRFIGRPIEFKFDERELIDKIDELAGIDFDKIKSAILKLDNQANKQSKQKLGKETIELLKQPRGVKIVPTFEEKIEKILPESYNDVIQTIITLYNLNDTDGKKRLLEKLQNRNFENDLEEKLFADDKTINDLIFLLENELKRNETKADVAREPEEMFNALAFEQNSTKNELRKLLKEEQIKLYKQYAYVMKQETDTKSLEDKVDEILVEVKKKK